MVPLLYIIVSSFFFFEILVSLQVSQNHTTQLKAVKKKKRKKKILISIQLSQHCHLTTNSSHAMQKIRAVKADSVSDPNGGKKTAVRIFAHAPLFYVVCVNRARALVKE